MRLQDIIGYDIFEDGDALDRQRDAIKRQQNQLRVRAKQIDVEKAKQTSLKKQRQLLDLTRRTKSVN
ncbi:hypothetical protein A6A40_25055 (plasmid) [Azospirillum humicireducens]|uniref:Uncharacterized protein n=1 Tax=Azospirillum humicireducens TaxID=1226968 RepID=A0A2R4VV95_9PROT|nr:hypothetical protein [Azospirillum humicireducens]AWB08311.1 hypothetical protein A6A40_25055 [Azospirillum humicireducens]